jgi:hypothetical protein
MKRRKKMEPEMSVAKSEELAPQPISESLWTDEWAHSGKSEVQRAVQKAATARDQANEAIIFPPGQPQTKNIPKSLEADHLVSPQLSDSLPNADWMYSGNSRIQSALQRTKKTKNEANEMLVKQNLAKAENIDQLVPQSMSQSFPTADWMHSGKSKVRRALQKAKNAKKKANASIFNPKILQFENVDESVSQPMSDSFPTEWAHSGSSEIQLALQRTKDAKDTKTKAKFQFKNFAHSVPRPMSKSFPTDGPHSGRSIMQHDRAKTANQGPVQSGPPQLAVSESLSAKPIIPPRSISSLSPNAKEFVPSGLREGDQTEFVKNVNRSAPRPADSQMKNSEHHKRVSSNIQSKISTAGSDTSGQMKQFQNMDDYMGIRGQEFENLAAKDIQDSSEKRRFCCCC